MNTSKVAKLVRIMTLAPIMALLALTVLFKSTEDVFGNTYEYIMAVFFLVILPILA